MGFQIAIDGPSGSGKSTIARMLAKKLNFIYVDTGAMYRTVGLFVLQNSIEVTNDQVKNHLEDIKIDLKFIDLEQHIFLNGRDVTLTIRSQNVADYASKVAELKSVREKLVNMQREIGNRHDVVMDGRDIGTNVLPNAQLKIYLDASTEKRIERRINELEELGEKPNFDIIKHEIEDRDYRDINREINPLIKAYDAIYIDSSNFNQEKVIDEIMKNYDEIK